MYRGGRAAPASPLLDGSPCRPDVARLLLGGLRPGAYPRGGAVHLKLWFADQFRGQAGPARPGQRAPWMSWYARLLGAQVGEDADLHSPPPITGLLRLGRGASVEPEVDLSGACGTTATSCASGEIRIGAGATVGSRSTLLPGTKIGKYAQVAPGSAVEGAIPAGTRWAGAPAARLGKARRTEERAARSRLWVGVYALSAVGLSLLPVAAAATGLAVLLAMGSWWALPVATVAGMAVFALVTLVSVRLLSICLHPGQYPVHSRPAWQAWATGRLMASARVWLFPLYASILTPAWLRRWACGWARDVELSTVLALPSMTSVGDGAFLADDTMVAPVRARRRLDAHRRGPHRQRAFLGNSGMTAAGARCRRTAWSAYCRRRRRRPSPARRTWACRRSSCAVPTRRATAAAPTIRRGGLKAARALVESLRLLPATCTVALACAERGRPAPTGPGVRDVAVAALAGGPVLLAAGAVAAATRQPGQVGAPGQDRPRRQAAVELVRVAQRAGRQLRRGAGRALVRRAVAGQRPAERVAALARGKHRAWGLLPHLLAARGDLVSLGDGACVNRGCVLQTHLFHDRVMSIDTVDLGAGATLGPHGVVLPAARIGAHTTVGPASLVMRGEDVPEGTRWFGNPISPWR
ncbi:hypothetical protein [Nonomuraea dietziae]|uniref:hypothetical protein n=1 Tax=Nonomuraea dietziae TaxID=65515 RepID=UPI0031E0392D